MQRYPKCFQKDKTDVKIVDCTEGILEKFKIDNSTLLGEKQSDSARPRIDVEQAIKRIKDFSILNGAFPMKMVNLLKNIYIHIHINIEILNINIHLTYILMYAFQSESTLYSCLNVKELLARNRRDSCSLSGCNGTRT